MIKLNNKNITYVALADSSNSIKAPKEIWYADTNNSVKLVYRRKDALIEGEDYEKYHWILTDTGTPYIQVDDICNTDENAYIETTYKSKYTNPESDILIGFSINETDNIGLRIFNSAYNGGTTCVDYHKVENGVLSSKRITLSQSNINAERYIKATFNNLIIDNTEYPTINWGSGFDNLNFSKTLLHTNQHSDNDVRYKRTKLRVNFKEHDLIPCKLLKPVPKWLDANGIRRQVGECGMIDLVSGKFYGNVNSVGTFTVENYYERKEWLVGDESAYIDTNIIVDVPSLYINTSFTKREGRTTPLFGSRNLVSTSGSQIWYLADGDLRLDIITNGTDYVNVDSNYIQSYNQLIVDCPNKVVSVNGTTFLSNVDNLSIKNSSNTFKIFSLEVLNNSSTYNKPYNGAFGNFTLNDSTHSLNLIPCTLTMDLPASMDANNIARTKGTSGMWDLVSDRFYGNVANSGTFKAVNLADGVGYEVHDILKTLAENTSSAPYDVAYFRFPNYIPLTGKVLTLKLGNVYRDYNLAGDIVNNARYCILIYRTRLITTIQEKLGNTVLNSVSNSSSTVEIDFDNNVVSVGTSTMNIQGTGYYAFGENYVSCGTEKYLKGLTISDVLNLIPVKLLKSIPAKYDANGIARQAGECGMYDTVNDVFYGNVASSGSFTVEDDS